MVPLFFSLENHFGPLWKVASGETGLNDWKIEHKAVRQSARIYIWFICEYPDTYWIYWTKYLGQKSQPWKKQLPDELHYAFYFTVKTSKMLYEKLISLHCNVLHDIGMTRPEESDCEAAGRPKVYLARSSTAPLEENRGPRYCRPHPRAFHK